MSEDLLEMQAGPDEVEDVKDDEDEVPAEVEDLSDGDEVTSDENSELSDDEDEDDE